MSECARFCGDLGGPGHLKAGFLSHPPAFVWDPFCGSRLTPVCRVFLKLEPWVPWTFPGHRHSLSLSLSSRSVLSGPHPFTVATDSDLDSLGFVAPLLFHAATRYNFCGFCFGMGCFALFFFMDFRIGAVRRVIPVIAGAICVAIVA